MGASKTRKAYISAIGPILSAIVLTWIIWPVVFAPNANSEQRFLTDEFNSLPLPPLTQLTTLDVSPKRGRVLLIGTYKSSRRYEDLKSFYGSELESRGWRNAREEKVTDWGRDFGGRQVHFCRGPYEAVLQYAGERSHYDYDYAFTMTWHLRKLCS
jgi:hypothetical protein